MNIEELKLVLETVATVTDDAKSVAIWYFVFNYGASFVLTLVGMVGFGWLVWVITRAILSTNEWAQIGVRIAREWGAQSARSTYHSPNSYDNLPAIDKCLAAAKEQKK
jgi:3-methyladenine DNA glycosylase/8-oxoguanine DNA glycosylase